MPWSKLQIAKKRKKNNIHLNSKLAMQWQKLKINSWDKRQAEPNDDVSLQNTTPIMYSKSISMNPISHRRWSCLNLWCTMSLKTSLCWLPQKIKVKAKMIVVIPCNSRYWKIKLAGGRVTDTNRWKWKLAKSYKVNMTFFLGGEVLNCHGTVGPDLNTMINPS